MKRVPPSKRAREAIAELLEKGTAEKDPLSELIRLSVQSVVEEALEGAVGDLLGREYYRHGSEGKGYRNGYRQGRIQSSDGEVRYASPQVREVDTGELQAIQRLLKGRSEGQECFPSSLRQRCLAHKMRNLAAKLPESVIAEFKKAAQAAYQAPSVAMARVLAEDLRDRFGQEYPTATRCFDDDFEACIAHLHCPSNHHRYIRTTNLLERLFGEERRRMKAVGTIFGERPVLKLMYSAVIRASDNWRGVKMTEFELGLLKRLQKQLEEAHRKENQPVVDQGSSADRIHSKDGLDPLVSRAESSFHLSCRAPNKGREKDWT